MKNEILEKTNVFEIYRELLEHESSRFYERFIIILY